MSTIIIAAILIGIVAVISILLIAIDKKQKRKHMNRLLHSLSESGTKHNLTFSSQAILRDCIIGLDGVRRKLFVLRDINQGVNKTDLIDLIEVKRCSIKKQYGTIAGGALPEKRLETFLKLIVLHFEFTTGKEPVEIPFYDHIENHVNEISELEQKARHWETVLSKMINGQVQKIA